MKSFILRAPCRLESQIKYWDSQKGTWAHTKLKKPRLIQNPQQQLDAEQTQFLKSEATRLAEYIKAKHAAQEENLKQKKDGPLDFVYAHFQLLDHDGLSSIQQQGSIRQLEAYVWDLVDRFNDAQMSWDEFKNKVEEWYLFVADRLPKAKQPSLAGVR